MKIYSSSLRGGHWPTKQSQNPGKLKIASVAVKRSLAMTSLVFLSFGSHPLFAMAQRPADPNAPPPPAWVQYFPFVVMIAVFYFLLIRPQMRQKKEKDNLLTNLKKGDRVVTTGGLIGTIMNIDQNTMDLKLNEETKVKVLKSAVLDIYNDPAAAPLPTVIVK